MPQTKTPLSFERHVEIGQELKRVKRILTSLTVEVGNAYPVTGEKGAAHRRLALANAQLSEARSALENRMFADYPELAETSVYYGDEAK